MIDPATADCLKRIAERASDVAHAYDPAFRPQSMDVARRDGPESMKDGDPLSLAAPPGAYFVVRGRDGKELLTQDGGFQFIGGTLRTREGYPVLGFTAKRPTLGAISADPVDVALKRASDARVDKAGFVSCKLSAIDPNTGAVKTMRSIVGRVALVTLPAGTQLIRVDGSHARAPAGVASRIGAPGEAGLGGLEPYRRQLGAVDLAAGLDRLREAYLEFEALQAAHKTTADVDKAAMDLLK
jgi:flagellar basal body rod protein FlgG